MSSSSSVLAVVTALTSTMVDSSNIPVTCTSQLLTSSAIESLVSLQDLMISMLTGLPPEYESFVTAVMEKNALHFFDDLCNKLLQQEQRQFDGKTLRSTKFACGLYPISSSYVFSRAYALVAHAIPVDIWHSHLGHPHLKTLHHLQSHGAVKSSNISSASGEFISSALVLISSEPMLTSSSFRFSCHDHDSSLSVFLLPLSFPSSASSIGDPSNSSCLFSTVFLESFIREVPSDSCPSLPLFTFPKESRHSMVTHFKAGICKPKHFLSLHSHVSSSSSQNILFELI
ncbi:hypothetical protein ACH5RR_009428 [Cinchona calisaya]|uniref:GAG-pre-integrase domain-containing protein n=1 Tax=Cinchona calisaya TaxID=153742 RepID=A0ABD3AE98_9GENT